MKQNTGNSIKIKNCLAKKNFYENEKTSNVSKIYKEHLKINKQQNNPILKMDEGSELTPCQRNIQMGNNCMKRCSTSYGIREFETPRFPSFVLLAWYCSLTTVLT